MLAVGETIKIIDSAENERHCRRKAKKEFKILGIYRNHVLCEDSNGFKRSIDTGTLIVNGIIQQSEEIELLREERNEKYAEKKKPKKRKAK